MKRFVRIWKSLLVLFAVVMIPLALMGCGKKDEQSSTEHPSSEQPAEEHPAGDHPE